MKKNSIKERANKIPKNIKGNIKFELVERNRIQLIDIDLKSKFKVAISKQTKDLIEELTPNAFNTLADYCLDLSIQAINEYMVELICTKSIPMPNPDSNSIAESINNFFKHTGA